MIKISKSLRGFPLAWRSSKITALGVRSSNLLRLVKPLLRNFRDSSMATAWSSQ